MVAQGRQLSPGAVLTLSSTLLALGLILASCGKDGEKADSPPPEGDVPALLEAIREAYGGTGILESVSGYRAEAVLSEARQKRTGELVLWYRHPDRLRMEYRYPEGGHLQILNRDRAWLGADDRSLEAADSVFVTAMHWEARCRGLPWSLLEDADSLVFRGPDEKGHTVLRTGLADGRVLDHHIDPGNHRIVRLILRDASDKALYEMNLSEFRWIEGFLIPFRETVSDRGVRSVEIRFRDVKIDPDFPDPLFEPGS